MPSTSQLSRKVAKLLLVFCSAILLGTIFMLSSAPATSAVTPASASASTDVTVDLGASISVRVLDTTLDPMSLLAFDLTPTADGVTANKRAVVDVSTSNITGYKLYVEANGKDHNNNYTTNLVQTDTEDSHVIPTSTSTASNKNFWNYVNPLISTTSVIPAHGTPDKIGQATVPADSSKTNVDINVGIDTTITAGTYQNQLLFTAIANEDTINYSLSFNANLPSGADPSTLANLPANQQASSVASSYTFTIPDTAPTLTGYNFVNYQDSETSTETYNPGDTVTVVADTSTSSSAVSGSKTLKAIWSNITYNIDFDANAPTGTTATGTTASMTNLDYNTSYNLTTNGYAVTGYTFGGWCSVAVTNPVVNPATACAAASGTYYANSASVQGLTETSGSTITMHALWTINNNTVTVTAGTGIASTTGSGDYDYGTTVTVGHTESAGYHFTSWTTVSGGVTVDANNQFTMPANDVEVTANGAINTCPITYNSNAPSGSTASGTTANSSMTYNQTATLTTNGYSVTGYQFDGWATTSDGAVAYTTTIPAADTATYCTTHNTTKTLYAHWTKKYTYTLNLNTNDGTSDKQILNYPTTSGGTTSTSHAFTNLNSYAPTRSGYNFLGWATSASGTSYVTSRTLYGSNASSTPTSDGFPVTGNLYARWEMNCSSANRICYVANAPSGTVSGTMDDQTIVYMTSSTSAGTVDTTALSGSTTELTLYSPNWTLTGYGFKGWSEKKNPSSTDKIYGPNETITLSTDQKAALGAGGIRLYAQWVANAGNMASWSGCSSLAQGSVTALTYGSDTYAVAKLADGKCWMIENLRTAGAGYDKGASWTSTVTDQQYNLLNISNTTPSPTENGTAYYWKSYGGYYSWHSAINTTEAGSTQYSNWNGSSYSTSTNAAAQGICPSGWRLPRSYAGSSTNNRESDFRYLNNQLNGSYSSVSTAAASNAWRTYPNNFVFAGYWRSTSSYSRGTYGVYWSSTVYGSNLAYNLYFGSTYVLPASYSSKNNGGSVRCVAADRQTVTVSNSNTTSGAASISVPEGGSATVTVTPSSGYYLSNVSCPSGYTCSGYSTGTSATGQQTVTVAHNGATSGGTLTFTGVKTLKQTCSDASTDSTFTYSGKQYIKLRTNSTGSTTDCYTKDSQGTADFDSAAALCPSGTGVPTSTKLQRLINAYGSDGTLYNTTGWSGHYWSSTPRDSDYAYGLYVGSSNTILRDYYGRTASNNVVCIVL
ncbi:InlB B-repeat-containing protein [Candidatus Saccharibacteria bacterium]|nr:InlB B-repeat-containing protein [Candidatus Saccharibacteria bacterium]